MNKKTIIGEAIDEAERLVKDGIPEKEIPLYLDPMIPAQILKAIISIAKNRVWEVEK